MDRPDLPRERNPATPTNDVSQPTRYLSVDRDDPDLAIIDQAAELLRKGGLVAFPTETVYGLGADATNPAAVAGIFEAKGRPANNPLIVHGHDVDAVRKAVSRWPISAAKLADRFWPGPLTLVLPRSTIIPDVVTAGHDTVGIRVPDFEVARVLLRRAGLLLAAPSANRSTGISPTRAEHVLKDLDHRIAMILDAGPTPIGIESTVLDLTTDPPEILRPGAITVDQLRQVLDGEITTKVGSGQPLDSGGVHSSPGQMEIHYAPRTPVHVVERTRLVKESWPLELSIGLIVVGHHVPEDIGNPTKRVEWHDPQEAAHSLYETLHSWDSGQLDVIQVVLPPETEAWRAVRDRLWRASRRWSRIDGPR